MRQLQNATLTIRSGFFGYPGRERKKHRNDSIDCRNDCSNRLDWFRGFCSELRPQVQVFGAYSCVHVDNGGLTGGDLDFALREVNLPFGTASNFTGWNAEGQYNFNPWIGLAGDVGGRYGMPITDCRNHNLHGLPQATGYRFLVGPVLSYRTKSRMTPFVHVLVGYDRAGLNATTIGYLRIFPGDCGLDCLARRSDGRDVQRRVLSVDCRGIREPLRKI